MPARPQHSFRSLALVASIVLIFGFLGVVFGQRIGDDTSSAGIGDLNDSLRDFSQVYEMVEQNYAEPVDPGKAIYNGAIPGMLRVLDPHSNFFDPKSYGLLREEQRGKYYGVGMQVGPRNNKVIVIAPFAGTPAYRAGIRPGDIIIAVDGKPTENLNTGNGGQEYPLVVLVNRGTASAAEIVAGAIQDHDRGLILGEVTFGKGLVQTVYPLSENTGLALTTAKYYTPSGRLIQRDYNGVSLYDYYYNRESEDAAGNKEVKLTDSGRTVYGGGGITPDVKVPSVKTNR